MTAARTLTERTQGHVCLSYPDTLTHRERQALRGVCAGQSNKEIARDLGLQEVTAKLHVKTLTRKMGARNRTHLAMIAVGYVAAPVGAAQMGVE